MAAVAYPQLCRYAQRKFNGKVRQPKDTTKPFAHDRSPMTQPLIDFPAPGTTHDVETGITFQPRFDAHGLLGTIVTDATTGQVLMFAWMNATALSETLQTGIAHFWSRSRGMLWKKGEESGNLLDVIEIRTDCDQDALLLRVHVRGAGVTCHTGAVSCFYRMVEHSNGVVTLRRA